MERPLRRNRTWIVAALAAVVFAALLLAYCGKGSVHCDAAFNTVLMWGSNMASQCEPSEAPYCTIGNATYGSLDTAAVPPVRYVDGKRSLPLCAFPTETHGVAEALAVC